MEYQHDLAYMAARMEFDANITLMETSARDNPEMFTPEKRANWMRIARLGRLMMEETEYQMLHRAADARELREKRTEARILTERNDELIAQLAESNRRLTDTQNTLNEWMKNN